MIYGGVNTPADKQLTAGAGTAMDNGKIKFGGILTFNDLRVGVTNFTVNFAAANPVVFNGSIFFATGGAQLFPGNSTFSATVYNRGTPDDVFPDGTPDTEAMRATLTFTDGVVDAFKFHVDGLIVTLGSYLRLTATDFNLDTGADTKGDPNSKSRIVQFGSLGAQIKVGGLLIGGEADNFGFAYDKQADTSTFKAGDPNFPAKQFAVILNIGSADGGSFGWPSWLPIHITTLGLRFKDFANHPSDFTIILSASVVGLPAVSGLKFSGAIDDIEIDPSLLFAGKFPVISLGAISVSISGNLFGGTLNAALLGGILQINHAGSDPKTNYSVAPAGTQGTDKVLYMAVQGGFSLPGIGGLTIRFALSELGPLGVFLNIEIPGGILLEPFTGLTINNFSAGVEFFKTLPSIEDPEKLRDPAFQVSPTVSADTWLASIKSQVFSQFLTLKANPSLNGFTAAFTQPLEIQGSADLFSIYTSQESFNAQVQIIISTDGKFLIRGKLNFAANLLSVSATLYADLSKITDGRVVVLFLADLPDQVRLLTIEGKFKMGFRSADGSEVTLDAGNSTAVVTVTGTTGDLVSPSAGQAADAGSLNANLYMGNAYVDVNFLTGAGGRLNYSSILDGGTPEISGVLTNPDGSTVNLTFNPVPLPIQSMLGASDVTDSMGKPVPGGTPTDTVVPGVASDAAFLASLQNKGVHKFRYLLTNSAFLWTPGAVKISFAAGSWSEQDGTLSTAGDESFTILGPTATSENPRPCGC